MLGKIIKLTKDPVLSKHAPDTILGMQKAAEVLKDEKNKIAASLAKLAA